jgi:hypothetical protein
MELSLEKAFMVDSDYEGFGIFDEKSHDHFDRRPGRFSDIRLFGGLRVSGRAGVMPVPITHPR